MISACRIAELGAQWLLRQFEADAAIDRTRRSLSAYYKAPCALLWSGHRDEALRLLDLVEALFLRPGGDLDGTGVPWFETYRIYPHSWLTVAAAELDRPQLAQSLSEYILTAHNPRTGGFRAGTEGWEEIMTTSMAGLAALRTGRLEIAAGVVVWLRRILGLQPDLRTGLWHVWHEEQGIVVGDGSPAWFVDAGKPRQWYFQYGIAAAFLAEYSRVALDSAALSLAGRFLEASKYCGSDVTRTLQSGKLGWGAAWVYRLNGEAFPLTLVRDVVEGLAALQSPDGAWNSEGVYKVESSNADTALDVTAEMVGLLSLMGAAIV